MGIYGFFGDKVKITDLLPFPDLIEESGESVNQSNKLTKETALEFRHAVRSGFIPTIKVAAFSPYLDEIDRLVK